MDGGEKRNSRCSLMTEFEWSAAVSETGVVGAAVCRHWKLRTNDRPFLSHNTSIREKNNILLTMAFPSSSVAIYDLLI